MCLEHGDPYAFLFTEPPRSTEVSEAHKFAKFRKLIYEGAPF